MPPKAKSQPIAVITGANGFIGRHLSGYLTSNGYKVHGLGRRDLDLLNPALVKTALENIQPDFIVHLAAKSAPGRDLSEFREQFQNTVLPAVHVAEAVPPSVKLAVFCGSCEEYGNGPAPFREEQEGVAFSPYGWAKISAFHAVTLVGNQRQIPWCWVRPFLTFGPGQNVDRFVGSIMNACIQNKEVPLTPCEQSRDFIYIKDLCGMFLKVLRSPELVRGNVLNLGSGIPRTLKEVAKQIQTLAKGGGKLNFGALPYRTNEAMQFFASVEKYEGLFGKLNLTPFDQAIVETLSTLHDPSYKKAA